MPDPIPAKKTSRRRFGAMTIILWVLVLALAGGLAYMYWQNMSLKKPEAQTKLAEEASQNVINSVSKLILVPEDKPTVATITDVDKLRAANESFYKNARNGDTLLLYSTEAIIFRTSENRIINVAPVVLNPDTKNATNSTGNAANTTPANTSNATNETNNTSNATNNATQ